MSTAEMSSPEDDFADNPYDLLAEDHDEGHRWAFGTGFTDPLVDCKESKQRYRADQLFIFKAVAQISTPTLETSVQHIELGFVAVVEDAFLRGPAVDGKVHVEDAIDLRSLQILDRNDIEFGKLRHQS